jgi:hypothetical protein
MQARESMCSITSPSVLGKGKACSNGITHRTLSKQSLWGQVSDKLTPGICINNASSNSRLTAVGRKPQLQTAIHRSVSRLFFFSLPTFEEKTTKLHLHAEKLTETVLHWMIDMMDKQINELRTKKDNIKEEMTQDMQSLRKKNETELQNKSEGQSSRIEQTEDRISELKDETVTKGKTKELLIKNSRPVKRKSKNSPTPLKDQT